MEKLHTRMVQFSSNKFGNIVPIQAIPGHFVTSHSHVNYFIDLTMLKSSQEDAQKCAHALASQYKDIDSIDTIICLDGTGIIGAIIIGIPLGVVSACKPNSIWDHISTFVAFIGASVPNFFLSLLLIYVLAVKMKLFPTSGMYSAGTGGDWKDLLYHLALPAFVCGIQPIGNYIKQTKSSVLEVLNEEYIKTARSKGLRNVVIVIKHAFRNSLIPIVTTLSLSVPFLIGGAVVTEQIFAWPGIGSLMITAITSRDYPVIMGVAVLICVVVLVVNLILDLIYAALDPRIKFK